MTRTTVVAVVALVVACSSRPASRPDTPAPAPNPTAHAAGPDSTEAPPQEAVPLDTAPEAAAASETADPVDAAPPVDPRCDALHRELLAALATLPSPCTADTDCVCYAGGIAGFTHCGGVSDRPTADRINAVTRGYDAIEPEVDCPHGLSIRCAPRLCLASCVAGFCREGEEGSPSAPIGER